MPIDLAEIIDLSVLRDLAETLWKTSGLPTKIVDPEGKVLVSAGNQELCFLFHRRHPVTLRQCIESDTDVEGVIRPLSPGDVPVQALCRNGLVHIGLPLLFKGRHLATLFLSQFLYDPPDEEAFRRRARELNLDEERYVAALRRVPVLDRERVQGLLGFYSVLVRLLTEMGTRKLELMESERFEALVAAISTRFVEYPLEEIDEAIDLALRDLGEFAGADRCYLFLFSPGGDRLTNTHEWCAAGIPPEKERLQDVAAAELPWIVSRLRERQVVHVPCVSALPNGSERAHLLAQGIRSLLSVPLFSEGSVCGFIGFDAVHSPKGWDLRDIALLRTIGDILGSALERRRGAEALEYRVRLEALIAAISTRMVNLPPEEVDDALTAALKELGEFVGVDRCYLFQFREEGRLMDNSHEWTAPGISPFKADLQGYPTDSLPWFTARIRRRETVHVPEVEALGEEARGEKEEWRREAIRSLLCVPMAVGEKIVGFVGFDAVRATKRWPEEIIFLLRIVGECFANALERRRSDRALREIDRIKSEFISTAAHELRTPLASIMGYAELLAHPEQFGTFSPEQQREFQTEIVAKAEELTLIVNDLLDLSRVDSGQLVRLDPRPGHLPGVLEEAVRTFSRLHGGRRFELHLQGELPEAVFDPSKIRQVLDNLLENAVKFSRPETVVRVEAARRAEAIEIGVRDEGIGMTPEQIACAFDKFYRGDASNTAVGGLGLGMTIVRNIVEAHGGTIRIESAPGRGTLVAFTLPLSS